MSGTKGTKVMNRLSVGVGKLPSRVEVGHLTVAWSSDVRLDEISARVTKSRMKHKAVELHPMSFRPNPAPHDLDGSKRHRNNQVA